MKATRFALFICALNLQVVAQSTVPALVSSPGITTLSASGHSHLPLLSADGRYVVYLSTAKNLVTNDNFAPCFNVFRHDLVTGRTTLISTGADADCSAMSVSSNGQMIAFASGASNLLAGLNANSGANIFLADADTLSRSLISVAADGNSPPNPAPTRNLPLCGEPLISDNGRWVAFESFATNLVIEADINNDSDVFLRDVGNSRTVLISVALGGGTTANGKSELVSMTPDGNYVLFVSTATNLVENNPPDRLEELYLRDVVANSTTWIPHSEPKPYACRWAVLSRDGRYILYKIEFSPRTPALIHLYDRQGNTNILVTDNAHVDFPIHMSSDARFIAYDERNQVFFWDRQTDTRTLVSSGDANETSHSPVVSEDGSIVVFITGTSNTASQIYYRNTATTELHRLTQTLAGGPSRNDHYNSSITVDPAGEFIVFDSAEDGLVSDDGNRASDIFIHQIDTRETRLISRADESRPSLTAVGKSGITNFCVSADGNRILFFSSDSTLVPGDTNGWPDAFVYELSSHTTYALTTNANGFFGPTNLVVHGVLSGNGRFALLGLLAPSTFCEFRFAPVTVLRKDLETGETIKLLADSPAGFPFFPPAVTAFAFSLSADGRWVTYPSNGIAIVADMQTGIRTNLTPSGAEPLISPDGRYVSSVNTSTRELALTDIQTGQRTIINARSIGGSVAFSQDSKSIVYGAPAGVAPGLYVYSMLTRSNTLIGGSCANASLSSDARFVVYEKTIAAPRQIELKDMLTGRTIAVTRSVNGIGGGNTDALRPVISGDGRFVAYTSKATNLTTDSPNGWNNLYIYDRLQGATLRITGSRDNTDYGSGSASRPVIAADGRTVVFQSFASDFVANDFNDTRDVFVLKLGEGDADNDGMSDSWEQTYFGTTERDGTGDFDQDGQTDLAEYLAGTDPTNNHSVFQVLTITSVNTGQRQVIWRAEPGKSYRVEYKSDLQGATWTSLGQIVTASGPTASTVDTSATSGKRFYRVALLQ